MERTSLRVETSRTRSCDDDGRGEGEHVARSGNLQAEFGLLRLSISQVKVECIMQLQLPRRLLLHGRMGLDHAV